MTVSINPVLSYVPRKRGVVRIRIAPNHHNRTLETAKELAKQLYLVMSKIPNIVINDEYQINIMIGRMRGVMCVETNALYTMPDNQAIEMIEAAGFKKGFEPVV